jgi:hypothetical protein
LEQNKTAVVVNDVVENGVLVHVDAWIEDAFA